MTHHSFEQLRLFNDALLDALDGSPDYDKFRSSVIDREAAQVVFTFKGDPGSWRDVARTLAPEGAYQAGSAAPAPRHRVSSSAWVAAISERCSVAEAASSAAR